MPIDPGQTLQPEVEQHRRSGGYPYATSSTGAHDDQVRPHRHLGGSPGKGRRFKDTEGNVMAVLESVPASRLQAGPDDAQSAA